MRHALLVTLLFAAAPAEALERVEFAATVGTDPDAPADALVRVPALLDEALKSR